MTQSVFCHRCRESLFLAAMFLAVFANTVGAQSTFSEIEIQPRFEHGESPEVGLIVARDGRLCGTTFGGGSLLMGTVYCINPDKTLDVLRNIDSSTDGAHPNGELVQTGDGSFYGT